MIDTILAADRNILLDNHGRPMNYLRLAVTDRCNLRCFYCMPEEGIKYLPKKELLTYEEMLRLCRILADLGISKIRITGGEPFVRNDLMDFISRLNAIDGIDSIHLTTNGVLAGQYINNFGKTGIKSVNLSLDTFDRKRFHEITRRDEFDQVVSTFHQLLEHQIPVKINAVVMEGKNIEDILPLVDLTRLYPVDVRFIEEMPFNGEGMHYAKLSWNHKKILDHIKTKYPELNRLEDPPNSTSYGYQVPGHVGKFGIIAAFSRTFCGSCNRIRLTAQGQLKTCLYDEGVYDLKTLIRSGVTDDQVTEVFKKAFNSRARDGFEAEQRRKSTTAVSESMSTIGG